MKIKELIQILKTDPQSIMDALGETELNKILDYLSDKYYNDTPVISDELFDLIKEHYEKEFKKSYKKVGANIKTGIKVKLPYWMGSLDKIKPSTNAFNNWIKKFTGPYAISWKLDGVSALLYKSNGNVYMYTRGNGIEGQDISHCINLIGINIAKMSENDAIRGELIISKENFKKINDKFANPRNAVSGIISNKKPDKFLLKLVDFVGYWVLSPQLKISEQLKYIEKKEFVPRSVEYEILTSINTEQLSKKLIIGRNSHKYEIDGIVVLDDSKYYPLEPNSNPSYGFAYKQLLTDQIAETTVIDVLWEVSKDKYIKPKLKFNKVKLGGVEIEYVTAHNAKFIVENIIGPGSVITLVRSGDVIPKIENVIKPASNSKPKMPSIKYEWNETKVDIIANEINDDTIKKIKVKKLTYFFKKLDIKWMGESTIEKFVLYGFDDIWKIIDACKNKKTIQHINGFGDKLIDKLHDTIENGLTGRTIQEIMVASGIFGRGISSSKIEAIFNDYENIIDIYKQMGPSHTKKLINNISGFDTLSTNKIVDSMDEFIIYLDKFLKLKPNLLLKNEKNEKNTNTNTNTNTNISKSSEKYNVKEYKNKKIAITGFRINDDELDEEFKKNNVEISDKLTKKTDLLVYDDSKIKSSNKLNKAIELEITIISKNDFLNSIQK